MPRSTKIEHVQQKDTIGCFVASCAMILGVSYDEAHKIMFPTRYAIIDINESFSFLKALGFDPTVSRARQMRNMKRTAVCILRWSNCPSQAHAFVWDAKERRALDPLRTRPMSVKMRKRYEKQLEYVFYVDVAKARRRIK